MPSGVSESRPAGIDVPRLPSPRDRDDRPPRLRSASCSSSRRRRTTVRSRLAGLGPVHRGRRNLGLVVPVHRHRPRRVPARLDHPAPRSAPARSRSSVLPKPSVDHRGLRPRPTASLLSVIWVAVPFTLFPIAEQHINSSVTGLLNGATPIFAATVAARAAAPAGTWPAADRHRRRLRRHRADQPAVDRRRRQRGARCRSSCSVRPSATGSRSTSPPRCSSATDHCR